MSEKLAEIFSFHDDKKISVDELEAIRTALVTGLNIMEKVAVAYHYNVADREILDAAFRPTIVAQVFELKHLFDYCYATNHMPNLVLPMLVQHRVGRSKNK